MFCCLVLDPSSVRVPGALEAVARACSPRVEPSGPDTVVFDASGLRRVLGPPSVIAAAVNRLAVEHQVSVRVALADSRVAAWLLAHARPGITVVPPGEEAALAGLPMATLLTLREEGHRPQATGHRKKNLLGPAECLLVLSRWGLHTLGDLARLPRADVQARLGATGARLHQAACAQDMAPLTPAVEAPHFAERIELEWPIDGLEPLSFVLSRLCDQLSSTLERADRGAVTVTTRLRLVTRANHERVLNLPAPMRDARVLRTLILLDLESHPPDAAIDVIEIGLAVTPGRILQGSLLTQALPLPEDLATLIARLGALMGETRVGAPTLVDTYDDRAVAMVTFAPGLRPQPSGLPNPRTCLGLRRFRLPIAARVVVERGAPVRVVPAARGWAGGAVVACAGPWRTSGRWWSLDRAAWDRDEWDVELAESGVYRLARDRITGRWEIEGIVD